MWSSVKKYLLTGIAVIAPIGVTALILYWAFVRLDAILGRLLRVWGVRFPGLGLLALLILLVSVGWIAQRALGRQAINLGRRSLGKFPLVRGIYNAASQIIESLVSDNRRLFKSCILVEYPRAGCWTLGFLTNQAAPEIAGVIQEESVAVFLPTAPNPTSGYLVFLPTSQVRRLRMSIEDGFKVVISGGAVSPELLQESTPMAAAQPPSTRTMEGAGGLRGGRQS